MTTPAAVNPPPSSTFETQSPSPKSGGSSSIWGRIVSISSKIFSFFKNIWNEHSPKFIPLAERAVKAIGIGVVVGLFTSILTGSPLITLAMGAAGGAGYIVGSILSERNSKAKSL